MVTSHKIDENKMGDRGSKSDLNFKSVKEQRVDGSCFGLYSKLRCTLMGFERNYPFKILSKQLNNKTYSTSIFKKDIKPELNPWFITGFTDAEGSFSILIYPDNRSRLK
jgi:hypothetical protein